MSAGEYLHTCSPEILNLITALGLENTGVCELHIHARSSGLVQMEAKFEARNVDPQALEAFTHRLKRFQLVEQASEGPHAPECGDLNPVDRAAAAASTSASTQSPEIPAFLARWRAEAARLEADKVVSTEIRAANLGHADVIRRLCDELEQKQETFDLDALAALRKTGRDVY